ncbi:MAG TPA: flagellar export chaperone FliS [Woeseiaceae bacterium]|nr:flagellar export chaperone FliS [Woeseiaceae bacterium]
MLASNANSAARAYESIDLQSRVEGATPHRLIQLMMERALAKIGLAAKQMVDGNVHDKGNNISGAISIVNGLQASLNHKANARIAENFDALYAYMTRRLLEANLQNDAGKLNEVSGLLRELKEAWDAIADDAGEVSHA